MSRPWSALNDRLFYAASVMCAGIAFLLLYLLLDKAPPQVRLSATINHVSVTRDQAGKITSVKEVPKAAPGVVPRGGSFVPTWVTTRRTRECLSSIQVDIVDVKGRLWPQYTRNGAASYRHDPTDSARGLLVAPPSAVDEGAAPGPARYIVTSFFYCNWLQKWLRWRELAIVQKGPPVTFRISP